MEILDLLAPPAYRPSPFGTVKLPRHGSIAFACQLTRQLPWIECSHIPIRLERFDKEVSVEGLGPPPPRLRSRATHTVRCPTTHDVADRLMVTVSVVITHSPVQIAG